MSPALTQGVLDYARFVGGMSFLFVAVVALALHRDGRGEREWRALAVFAGCQALTQWSYLLFAVPDHHPFMPGLRLVLTLGSLFSITEFVRRGASGTRQRTGTWIHLPVLILAAVGASQLENLETTTAYALMAVLLTTGLVFPDPDPERPAQVGRGILRGAGLALAAVGVTNALMVPPSPLPPSCWINHVSVAQSLPVPLELPFSVLALGLAMLLFTHLRRRRLDRYRNLRGRPYAYHPWLAPVVVALLATGAAFSLQTTQRTWEDVCSSLLRRSATAAAALNPAQISMLLGTPADKDRPDFVQVREQLARIRRANADTRFVYLMGWRDGTVFFFADGEPSDSPDYSPPGQTYDECSAQLRRSFRRGDSFVEGPVTDRWGCWVSARAPVRREGGGAVLAMLGMDLNASDLQHALTRRSLHSIVISGFVLLLAVALSGLLQLARDSSISITVSEEKFRAMFELSPTGIVLCDFQGRFLQVNAAFAKMIGYSIDACRGKTFWDLTAPEQVAAEAEAFRHVLPAGRYGPFEKEYVRRDGSRMTAQLNCVAVTGPDGEPRLWATIEDITERKQTERQVLRAKEQAEAAARSKSEFLANMSHEIRTPMNAVIGMTGLLLDTPLNAEQRDSVDTIRSSGNALLGIINDILDFSKMEAGRLALEPQPFEPERIANDVVDLMADQAAVKGLSVGFSVDPRLPRRVIGDPGRVRQVLINLVGNAVKFTERGGVTIRILAASEAGAPLQVRFDVKDTGIGISTEGQTGLFTAFSQVDGSSTRRYGGTGLGLAISRRLVELMGGEIGVESQPGAGSRFWFRLPLQPASEAESASVPAQAAAAPLPRAHVLLAEDNAINQKVILRQLAKLGLTADAVANGREALAALQRGRYDLLLLDCQMPEMDGFETARRIRSATDAPWSLRLPIVAMTANALAGDRERCLAAGMNDYLSKPVSIDTLHRTLAQWLPPEAGAPASV